MNYYKAKRKWFDKNIENFTIDFDWYGWQYVLIVYAQSKIFATSKVVLPEDVRIIQNYLLGIEPCELFFECRRLSFSKGSKISIIYNTHNKTDYNISDLIRKGEIENVSTYED